MGYTGVNEPAALILQLALVGPSLASTAYTLVEIFKLILATGQNFLLKSM